ncbi:hypothetical protein D1872_283590 [compost metagenome]
MVIVLDIGDRGPHFLVSAMRGANPLDILIQVQQELLQGAEIVVEMAEACHIAHFAVQLQHFDGSLAVNPEHLIQHLLVEALADGLQISDIDARQPVQLEDVVQQLPDLFFPVRSQHIAKLPDFLLRNGIT